VPAPADHAVPATDATPASGSHSRWLAAGVDAPAAAPASSVAVLAPPTTPASSWLPDGLESTEVSVAPKAVDPLRWEPPPSSAGDHEAKADEPDRRHEAAEAYCRVVCPAAVAVAVAEALESAGDSDVELLHATRTAAAAHAAPIVAPKNWRQRLAAEHEQPCAPTPVRLAERANGTLGSREERELKDHLRGCEDCCAAVDREQEATAAFAAVLPGTPEGESAATAARWAPEALAATAAAGATAAAAPAPSATAAPAPASTAAPRRRRRLAPLLAAVVAILAIGGGAFAALHSSTKHHPPATTHKTVAAVPKPPAAHKTATVTRHKRTAVHHTSARRHHAVVHHPKHKVTHHASTPAPVVTSSPPTEPATSAPVVTSHPVTPVVPTQPSSTSVSSVSQSSLPSENAPQSGVGNGSGGG
jgi:hypothetical protein